MGKSASFARVAAVAAIWAMSAAVASATTFTFDKGYTLLTFSWTHFGLSRQQARFNAIDGSADIDPQNPETSKIEVSIRTTSVQSGNDAFDRILRSPDYFNAATHPTISFHSSAVARTGETTADVTGDLRIAGVSKPVTLHVTLSLYGEHPAAASNPAYAGKTVAAFSAVARIKRSDWGMTLGIPAVSDDVDIAIETELVSGP